MNNKKIKRNFKTIEIGLKDTRELIYERINNRVDTMVKDGLIQEVKELVKYKNLNSLNTIGYKEIFNYLDNTTNLKDTINKIKKNTRRFSKRQMTWFKSNKNITWFKVDYKIEEIIRYINDLISD